MYDLAWYKLEEAKNAVSRALLACGKDHKEYNEIKEIHERLELVINRNKKMSCS